MAIRTFLLQIYGAIAVEMQKLRHDPWELVTRAIQPVLWLALFGKVMAQVRGISFGGVTYNDFMSAGTLAQSILFVAISYRISAIWVRDLGVIQRYLVSPAPRTALVIGNALSASVRALTQAVIVYLLAAVMGVHLRLDVLHVAGVVAVIVLGSRLFSTFSLIVACIVKTRERFMGIGQVMTMPIFFASNAIYPVAMMPGWLQVVAGSNRSTYQVDALRGLMLSAGTAEYGVMLDIAVLAAMAAALIVIAARMYPRMGY
jgi:ABC-2 type transport system permease protein